MGRGRVGLAWGDRLVRQEALGDVPVREGGGGDERRVGDRDAVVHLIPVLVVGGRGRGRGGGRGRGRDALTLTLTLTLTLPLTLALRPRRMATVSATLGCSTTTCSGEGSRQGLG